MVFKNKSEFIGSTYDDLLGHTSVYEKFKYLKS